MWIRNSPYEPSCLGLSRAESGAEVFTCVTIDLFMYDEWKCASVRERIRMEGPVSGRMSHFYGREGITAGVLFHGIYHVIYQIQDTELCACRVQYILICMSHNSRMHWVDGGFSPHPYEQASLQNHT